MNIQTVIANLLTTIAGGGWFAFEDPADAVFIQMKWGTMDETKRALPKSYPGWR